MLVNPTIYDIVYPIQLPLAIIITIEFQALDFQSSDHL